MIQLKIVVPSFNSAKWLQRTLCSIEQQSYRHFQVCVIDDASTIKEQQTIISEFCNRNHWLSIFKTKNMGALCSTIDGIKALQCQDDDVIIIIDGDDWLFDYHVFQKIADVYSKQNVFLTFDSYITYPDPIFWSGKWFPNEVVNKKLYRQSPFLFGHPRTFKYILWRHILDEDFRDIDGEYFKSGGDLAFMWPMIEMAGDKFYRFNDVLYVYNVETPLNDFKLIPDEVARVRSILEKRKVYKTLPCCT